MPDITIPAAAVEAGADEFADAMQCSKSCERNLRSLKGVPCECANRTRAAFLAMLRAWPGAMFARDAIEEQRHVILPLTAQEKTDAVSK